VFSSLPLIQSTYKAGRAKTIALSAKCTYYHYWIDKVLDVSCWEIERGICTHQRYVLVDFVCKSYDVARFY
jgi:hypothetical protein